MSSEPLLQAPWPVGAIVKHRGNRARVLDPVIDSCGHILIEYLNTGELFWATYYGADDDRWEAENEQ